jgi:chemotaxis protein CheD
MIQSLGQDAVVVSLGEYVVTRDAGALLVCHGIGSCIAFTAHDAVSGVAAMAHFVLPDSAQSARVTSEARFVDTGVPMIAREMLAAGAALERTVFKMAGGAHMTVAKGFESKLNIGERNVEAVRAAMTALGLKLAAEDVGGTHGRTVRLYAGSGRVTITTAGGNAREL